MKYVIRIFCVLVVFIGLNVFMFFNWLPALFENIERGYYDAFSFIAVLCGNNPDDSVLHYLNYSYYNGVLFFIFMTPGILVSWLAFLTIYKLIVLDAPLSVFGLSRKARTEVTK
ncbi:TPA: hypothetical protein G8Z49_004536 [Salmonella enterica]|uniref:Uncharacterized protein n=1 Tax=Salmonella enterica TaxID=28901 RepID=A0A761LX10_SALER|nr:hypothetical protein [Salmonella enterica subsp. enterica serovar Cotham]EBV5485880.1 hypothetical protein [Salmonella enterica subsp. enterica serovar Pomona]ECG2609109.1 hypothetical protein [Salmonella enterica subsp. enterica serovar Montevideo]ECI4179393.1 hypothetical protein [Salmonella enterica subsp. diarizonae]EDW6056280.1 hypothetical protein [Salmonella enterica subsp. enterica]EDX8891091.1 hypothetical protein [Salmonella enterica subsp. enterica serovar Cerro]HAF2861357.1 hyp